MNQGFAAKKYQPILEIGSGGMSRVYLTVVRGPGGFNKFQVVKRLLPSLAGDPEFLNMFLEEARLSARLNHANVVQINEVGFDGKHHLMAMEYLEGQSLESVVRRAARQGKALPLPLHLRVLAEAAAGLHYAHEFADLDGRPLNIVHRDVSPHNVFVTYQGQVKVLDFGIAKAADSSQHTRTGMLKGKVAYMAPEQLRRSEAVDRRADVFALGVMLWQAVAGRRLWQDLSDLDVFQRMSARQIPSLREAKPDAPDAIVRICERALAYDRADRYATAAELGDALEGFLAAEGRRVTSRELGAFVSELFAAKRAEVQALIEAALSQRPDSGHVPAMPRSLTGSHSTSMPAHRAASGGWPVNDRSPSGVGRDANSSLTPQPTTPTGGRPGGHGWRLWASAAALGLGASALTYAVIARSVRPPEAPAADPTAEVAAPAAPSASAEGAKAADAPKRVRLTVTSTPPNARLFVDDVPLSSNPGIATFTRDGLPHRVRAEAPGFVTDMKTVVYDEDEKSVSLPLQRDPRKAAAAWRPPAGKAPPAAPVAPPPAPTAPPPTATSKTSTPALDRENPWSPGR